AGVPLLSGFWSKDEILLATWHAAGHEHGFGASAYTVLFYAALLTAGLTAFYTFRAYFLTFWGPVVVPPEALAHGAHGADHAGHGADHGGHGAAEPVHGGAEAGHGVHESPPVMLVPMMILAVGAVGVGIFVEPF